MAPKDLRGKVAIVGASESDEMGKLPGKSVLTLHAESIRNALDDAGLEAWATWTGCSWRVGPPRPR